VIPAVSPSNGATFQGHKPVRRASPCDRILVLDARRDHRGHSSASWATPVPKRRPALVAQLPTVEASHGRRKRSWRVRKHQEGGRSEFTPDC
jgi:hypothetical protein